jgi:hypothetical protein
MCVLPSQGCPEGHEKEQQESRVWWCAPIIPALKRLRQEDREFQVILGCIGRPYLKIKRKVFCKCKVLVVLVQNPVSPKNNRKEGREEGRKMKCRSVFGDRIRSKGLTPYISPLPPPHVASVSHSSQQCKKVPRLVRWLSGECFPSTGSGFCSQQGDTHTHKDTG